MYKQCFMCDRPLTDDADIIAVVRAKYKQIPSKITFAIHDISEVHEVQHYECAKGDLIPEDIDDGPTEGPLG